VKHAPLKTLVKNKLKKYSKILEMTKQLERLNIKPPYDTRPIANTGHRHICKMKNRNSFGVKYDKYKGRSFKNLKDALCYKFILLLKIKSNIK